MSKVPMWLATYKVPIKSFMPVEKYVKKATTRTTKKMALGSTTDASGKLTAEVIYEKGNRIKTVDYE